MRRPTATAQFTPVFEMTWPRASRSGLTQRLESAAAAYWSSGRQRCAYLYQQGWQHQERGNLDTALKAFQELLIRGQRSGHQGWITAARSAIADLAQSLAWDGRAAAMAPTEPPADGFKLAKAGQQASLLYAQGRCSAAIGAYQQALAAATQTEQPLAIADCLNSLGLIYLDQQRYELAESRLQAAVDVLADQAAPIPSAVAYHNLGLAHYQQGQYQSAQVCFREASHHWQATADSLGLVLTLDYLGRVYAHQQAPWFALGSFEAAIDALNHLAEHEDVRDVAAALIMQIAALCEQTGHPNLAIAYWMEALAIYETLPDIAPCIVIWQRLSQLHQRAGQDAIARHYTQRILQTV